MRELSKAEWRARLKETRRTLDPEQKKALDAKIISHIEASDAFQGASMLLLYAPMKGEINLLPLARLARQSGIPIAFPKCDTESGEMQFHLLTESDRLSPGAYGIAEPPKSAPIAVPDEHALCILPGLSFDRSGNRLGYGKGYYDRFLEAFSGVTMGAAYSFMIQSELPTEEHDKPVRLLVSEEGFVPLKGDALMKPFEESKKEEPSTRNTLKRFWSASFDGRRPHHLPPLLVVATYLLLLLSTLIEKNLISRKNDTLGVILLQILVFVLPAALYLFLRRGVHLTSHLRLRPFRPSHMLFLLWTLGAMVTLGLLCSILSGGIASLEGNFTLYNTFIAHINSPLEIFYSVTAYALLPAIVEELVFRAILCAEYESCGVGVSLFASALFFSMLHMSLSLFLTYFVLGLLLACSLYVTRSALAPVLLHLCYNLFCLFGQPYLSAFYVRAGSHEIFLFCLIASVLLFSALTVGEARKIYHLYAVRSVDSTYTVSVSLKQYPKRILHALLSPGVGAAMLLFLIISIFHLS